LRCESAADPCEQSLVLSPYRAETVLIHPGILSASGQNYQG
jgi:hypothetical protein